MGGAPSLAAAADLGSDVIRCNAYNERSWDKPSWPRGSQVNRPGGGHMETALPVDKQTYTTEILHSPLHWWAVIISTHRDFGHH